MGIWVEALISLPSVFLSKIKIVVIFSIVLDTYLPTWPVPHTLYISCSCLSHNQWSLEWGYCDRLSDVHRPEAFPNHTSILFWRWRKGNDNEHLQSTGLISTLSPSQLAISLYNFLLPWQRKHSRWVGYCSFPIPTICPKPVPHQNQNKIPNMLTILQKLCVQAMALFFPMCLGGSENRKKPWEIWKYN